MSECTNCDDTEIKTEKASQDVSMQSIIDPECKLLGPESVDIPGGIYFHKGDVTELETEVTINETDIVITNDTGKSGTRFGPWDTIKQYQDGSWDNGADRGALSDAIEADYWHDDTTPSTISSPSQSEVAVTQESGGQYADIWTYNNNEWQVGTGRSAFNEDDITRTFMVGATDDNWSSLDDLETAESNGEVTILKGDIAFVYNSDKGKYDEMYVWNGSQFVITGDITDPSKLSYRCSTAPSSPEEGMLWFDCDIEKYRRYQPGCDTITTCKSDTDHPEWEIVSDETEEHMGDAIFYDSPSNMPEHKVGRVWYCTQDGTVDSISYEAGSFYRSDGSSWSEIGDVTKYKAGDINYISTSAPSNPKDGWVWLDTSVSPPVLKKYDQTAYDNDNGSPRGWLELATVDARWSGIVDDDGNMPADGATKNQIYWQSSQPTGSDGDIWVDTDTLAIYTNDSGSWTQSTWKSVDESRLEDLSISAPKIQDLAVKNAKIKNNAVDGTKITADAVDTIHLETDAVEANQVLAGAIGAAEVDTGVLTADHIDTLNLSTNQWKLGSDVSNQILAEVGNYSDVIIRPSTTDHGSLGTSGYGFNGVWAYRVASPDLSFDIDTNQSPTKMTIGKVDANELHGDVYYGDIAFEELECEVCGERFERNDDIILKTTEIEEDATKAIPIHLECSRAFKDKDSKINIVILLLMSSIIVGYILGGII